MSASPTGSLPGPGQPRVVLVTGAARRIGRMIALELAHAGWNVVIHHNRSIAQAAETAADLRALGRQVAVLQADLAHEAEARMLVPAAIRAMGRLDAVVNNASLFEYDQALDAGAMLGERHWRVNTLAPVALAQALHTHLAAVGRPGVVVNLLDQKLEQLNPDYFTYTLSKAALKTATTMLAQACAPTLRVCGVSPGTTLESDRMSPQQFARAQCMTPLGRSSTAEDIARAVRFVIECEAMTGTTLTVDGGLHLAGHVRDVAFLT